MPTKHVLAFEADPIYGELLRKELEARSATLTIVTDANEGLEKAVAIRPDLIYLCAELPRTSGFSVCYKLRKNPQTQSIPVVITSAEATEETIEKHKQLQNLRADEYVHKPFGVDVLRGLLDRYLGPSDGSGEILLEELESEPQRNDELSFEAVAVDDEAALAMDELEELEEIEPATAKPEPVEDDLDAFTDSAFASITQESVNAPPQSSATPETAAKMSPAPRISSIPPRMREISGTIDPGLATELAGLRQANADLERKVSKLERDLLEAKASKSGGTSSRELLDLREIINKKDRELLDVKDEANKKEKQLLDLRERITDAERVRADLEDRALGFEKQIADLNDKIAAQAADKEVLSKKGEDLQGRLNRAQEKIAHLEQELDEERKLRREERERAEADKHESLSRLEAEHKNALATVSADKDKERIRAEETLRTELEMEKQAALLAQKSELEMQAVASRDEALAEQRQRYEAQAQEAQARFETEKQEALSALRKELEDKAADVARGHAAVLEDWERKADELNKRIAALEEEIRRHQSDKSTLEDRLDAANRALAAKEAENSAATERIGELSTQLSDIGNRLATSDQSCAALKDELSQRNEKIALLEADLAATSDVLSRNDEIIGKTRQALAIATQLLEQIEVIETLGDAEEA